MRSESAFQHRRACIRIRSALLAGVPAVTVLSGAPAAAGPPGDCVTVAADGSADFTTIQSAVNAVPAGNAAPFVIKIKPGVYRGQVIVPADAPSTTEPERSIDPYLGS